jgi:hypothetical protein
VLAALEGERLNEEHPTALAVNQGPQPFALLGVIGAA